MNNAARSRVSIWVSSLRGGIRWHIASNDGNLISNKLTVVSFSYKKMTKLTFRALRSCQA